MVKQVQELIDQIKREGVEAAEKKAQEIERLAQLQGQKIIADAEKRSQDIIAKAQQQAKKLEDSAKVSIHQAGRDTLLSVRKEVVHMLERVIAKETHASLTAESLAEIIQALVVQITEKLPEAKIHIELSAKDKERLQQHMLAKLQKDVKKEIVIRASDDIGAGLRISWDNGKSSFDFSDESLAEYLSLHLNPQISNLLTSSKNK